MSLEVINRIGTVVTVHGHHANPVPIVVLKDLDDGTSLVVILWYRPHDARESDNPCPLQIKQAGAILMAISIITAGDEPPLMPFSLVACFLCDVCQCLMCHLSAECSGKGLISVFHSEKLDDNFGETRQ